MATSAVTPTTITIDVTKDLETLSDLKSFFAGQRAAIFDIGKEVAKFAGEPIKSAVGSSPANVTMAGDHSWELPLGIGLSLKADAKCTVAVSLTSNTFPIQKDIDSADSTNVSCGPADGVVYVNIDLDFDITGGVSGSGTVSGIGISGKASGASSATLSYCHPVSSTVETATALRAAFSALFFPFRPDCALRMPAGSLGKVSFSGSFNNELDLSYGFGSYKFSAQNLGLASDSVNLGPEKLKIPDATVDTGAKASVSYKHTDDFTVIVTKSDAKTAMVYLLRAADDEAGQSAGITVGISAASASASVDTQKLAESIVHQVNAVPPTLAENLASGASDLQASLVSKANNFLSSHPGNAGLMLSLSQQHGRTVLFNFKVDLTAAGGTLAEQSWTAMVKGDLGDALKMGGFTLLEDSGIAHSFKRASALQLHLFSFHLAKDNEFFRNSTVKIGADGSIRFFFDAGEESKYTVNHKSTAETVHFVATLTEDTWGGKAKDREIDLYIELSETNNPAEANRIASAIGAIPGSAVAQSAQKKMLDFVANNKGKTLTLIGIFKPGAYGKLSCSPYTTDQNGRSHPPALPQRIDRHNYEVFQNEVESLMHDLSVAVSEIGYPDWMRWNVFSNSQSDTVDDNHIPSRRNLGNFQAAGAHVFGNNWPRYQTFLPASSDFLNLCDDLHSLVAMTAAISTDQQWNALLGTLEKWIKADADPDWSKPAFGALLTLCSEGTAPQVTADFQQAEDKSSFTCTLTLS
jgi:hypothetical protein